jgi:hypothetical protein
MNDSRAQRTLHLDKTQPATPRRFVSQRSGIRRAKGGEDAALSLSRHPDRVLIHDASLSSRGSPQRSMGRAPARRQDRRCRCASRIRLQAGQNRTRDLVREQMGTTSARQWVACNSSTRSDTLIHQVPQAASRSDQRAETARVPHPAPLPQGHRQSRDDAAPRTRAASKYQVDTRFSRRSVGSATPSNCW